MDKKQFNQIINALDESIMHKVHKNYSVSIDEEYEVERACQLILKRNPSDEEFNEILISDELTSILDEVDDYITFREKAKQSRGHFEEFSHDAPFGSANRYRSDVPMKGGE